jgi:hypothetical protein
MQDLPRTFRKANLLHTLNYLLMSSPTSVQEHDIQNAVLPLLSEREEPVVVILVLKLLDSCDMSKFQTFYSQLAQRLYKILRCEKMMYPELLEICVGLVTSLCTQYDMTSWIEKTEFKKWVEFMLPQMDDFPEVSSNLGNCLYALNNGMSSGAM